LPLQYLHVHNKKKKQWYSLLSLSQQLLSTNIFAGRGLGLAHASLPQSDRRRVT
jgi:hypothetical protein